MHGCPRWSGASKPLRSPAPARTGSDRSTVAFALEAHASTYLEAVDRALEYINAGDTYEVCLTNRIRGTTRWTSRSSSIAC